MDPLKGMATHSSILAWRTSWTEEPGRLQSMGSQRVGHNAATNTTREGKNLLKKKKKKEKARTLMGGVAERHGDKAYYKHPPSVLTKRFLSSGKEQNI